MIAYAFIDQQGVILRCGKQANLPAGAVEVQGFTSDLHALTNAMIVDGAVVQRPVSPDVISSGTMHTINDIPAGTRIEVYDLHGSELMEAFTVTEQGATEIINLPDAGKYRIEVVAPLPHLPRYICVTT